jgi:hypothetical protein
MTYSTKKRNMLESAGDIYKVTPKLIHYGKRAMQEQEV